MLDRLRLAFIEPTAHGSLECARHSFGSQASKVVVELVDIDVLSDQLGDRVLNRTKFERKGWFAANALAVEHPVVLWKLVKERDIYRNALLHFFSARRRMREHCGDCLVELARSRCEYFEKQLVLRIEVLVQHRLCHVGRDRDVIHRRGGETV